jgi:hypothetical protein
LTALTALLGSPAGLDDICLPPGDAVSEEGADPVSYPYLVNAHCLSLFKAAKLRVFLATPTAVLGFLTLGAKFLAFSLATLLLVRRIKNSV